MKPWVAREDVQAAPCVLQRSFDVASYCLQNGQLSNRRRTGNSQVAPYHFKCSRLLDSSAIEWADSGSSSCERFYYASLPPQRVVDGLCRHPLGQCVRNRCRTGEVAKTTSFGDSNNTVLGSKLGLIVQMYPACTFKNKLYSSIPLLYRLNRQVCRRKTVGRGNQNSSTLTLPVGVRQIQLHPRAFSFFMASVASQERTDTNLYNVKGDNTCRKCVSEVLDECRNTRKAHLWPPSRTECPPSLKKSR